MMFESFELSTSVAANCQFKLNAGEDDCTVDGSNLFGFACLSNMNTLDDDTYDKSCKFFFSDSDYSSMVFTS